MDSLASRLMSGIINREVNVEVYRSEYYYWYLKAPPYLTDEEFETLLSAVDADDRDRELKSLEPPPIYELWQELACKLIEKALPFTVNNSHADDDGIWFVGEETGSGFSAERTKK